MLTTDPLLLLRCQGVRAHYGVPDGRVPAVLEPDLDSVVGPRDSDYVGDGGGILSDLLDQLVYARLVVRVSHNVHDRVWKMCLRCPGC